MNLLEEQLYGIAKGIRKGDFSIPDIGNILPASLMLHNMDGLQPLACSYMNNWGCERLGASVDELNAMGEGYYEHFFIKEESLTIFQGLSRYLVQGDFDKQYNFFQRVKLYGDNFYTWFYTVCKLVQIQENKQPTNKMILLSSPIMGMDNLILRVTKTLDQDSFIRNNYRKFAELTPREKEVITLLASGKSSMEIAELLFISFHTVSTHRKNIIRKIDCKSFAELLHFAVAFDLIN